jgi:hypothetical protein
MIFKKLTAGTAAIAVSASSIVLAASTASSAEAPTSRAAVTQSLSYSGTSQTYTVPADIRVVKIVALGGGGSSGRGNAAGTCGL